jgi:hypothetical protein
MDKAARKEHHEEAKWLSQRTTPLDEMSYAARGMLGMSAATVRGLCPLPRCLKKAEHNGNCWPTMKGN